MFVHDRNPTSIEENPANLDEGFEDPVGLILEVEGRIFGFRFRRTESNTSLVLRYHDIAGNNGGGRC